MKHKFLIATIAAAAIACATGASAHSKIHSHGHNYKYTMGTVTITVSCFRGPWREVIWDRPNAVFIDSLINAGYDHPTAFAIGQRICRDSALVGNLDRLRSEAIRVLQASPAHRR
ncbi:MAG: hypothetical protein GW905_12135 [Rhodobacterales bacterium]|nr:hypothetical protein [Rhodobacterales bacterium]